MVTCVPGNSSCTACASTWAVSWRMTSSASGLERVTKAIAEGMGELAREAGYTFAYAVGNRIAPLETDIFSIPRLTVQRSTTLGEFDRLVNGADTRRLRQDRLFTNGWSVVRRARRRLRTLEVGAAAG